MDKAVLDLLPYELKDITSAVQPLTSDYTTTASIDQYRSTPAVRQGAGQSAAGSTREVDTLEPRPLPPALPARAEPGFTHVCASSPEPYALAQAIDAVFEALRRRLAVDPALPLETTVTTGGYYYFEPRIGVPGNNAAPVDVNDTAYYER